MPSNFSLRVMNGAHRFVIAITGGRFGWFMYGMPMLELTTTGRKSGERRSTMLSSPMRVHGSYLVVASRGGDDTHPAWFLNLRDDPHVEVVIQGGAKEPRIARIATPEEREKFWPQITAKFANYGGYQEKTAREIPIVFLEPV